MTSVDIHLQSSLQFPVLDKRCEPPQALVEGTDYQIHPNAEPNAEIPPTPLLQLIRNFTWLLLIFQILFLAVIAPVLVVYSAIAIPWTRYFIAVYYAWMFYDTAGPFKGRKNDLFSKYTRFNPIWDHLAGYFSAKLIKTANIDPTKKYILGYHPHGVYAFALFTNIALSRHFAILFPGLETLMCTLPANFYVPFWRDYALAIGSGSCESKSLRYRINHGGPGTTMIIAIGGAEEFRHMDEGNLCSEGTIDLVILKRKGFAKLALETGSSLIPVIGFGENELFSRITHPWVQPLHKLFQATLKCSAPLFIGKSWGVFPANTPLVTIVGKPIIVEKLKSPTKSQIDAVHSLYLNGLQQLYDDFKDIYHVDRKREMRFIA